MIREIRILAALGIAVVCFFEATVFWLQGTDFAETDVVAACIVALAMSSAACIVLSIFCRDLRLLLTLFPVVAMLLAALLCLASSGEATLSDRMFRAVGFWIVLLCTAIPMLRILEYNKKTESSRQPKIKIFWGMFFLYPWGTLGFLCVSLIGHTYFALAFLAVLAVQLSVPRAFIPRLSRPLWVPAERIELFRQAV